MTRTPGTWKADVHTSNISQYPYVYSVDDQGHTIGEICRPEAPQTGGMEEAGENATLISLAPAMLDALKEIAKGEGAFSPDPLIHAANCIERAVKIATDIISKVEEA